MKKKTAEFLSSSLLCSLPRSHAAVLGILISNIRPMWLRSPSLRDATAADGNSTRPRAIALAMLTMKKRNAYFYLWFSSVCPISISMGLRYPALRAGETPLLLSFIPVI